LATVCFLGFGGTFALTSSFALRVVEDFLAVFVLVETGLLAAVSDAGILAPGLVRVAPSAPLTAISASEPVVGDRLAI
jgi:hypothetical protein